MNTHRTSTPYPFGILTSLLSLMILFGLAGEALALGNAGHVVIISWDGLRPDLVTPTNTPTLYRLAQSGTVFAKHHAVYPTSTEVNGVALATGAFPANSNIVGNREFRPKINPTEPIATESVTAVRLGDSLTNGKYLAAQTIYERLQQIGDHTFVAGSKPVAFLADRSQSRQSPASSKSVNVFAGKTLPGELQAKLEQEFGPFPPKPTYPDTPQNSWTTDVLVNSLWKGGVPKLSLLWLSDPDYSQHNTQPGSDKGVAALKANDDLLAKLLAALDAKGLRDKVDIFVVSDHGFSTIEQTVDFAEILTQAGFRAFRKLPDEPHPGDILVVGNGGTVFFYVYAHEIGTPEKLVRFLQSEEHSGVIFSDQNISGAFRLSAAHLNSADAPDVVVSMKWNGNANASGVKGMIFADSIVPNMAGRGMHGSLSPFDVHNTLIAAGPSIRPGYVDELPTGNLDVPATIYWLLGIAPRQPADGRILSEALRKPPGAEPKVRIKNLIATSPDGRKQYLKLSSVEEVDYIDEGGVGDPTKKYDVMGDALK